MCGLVGVFGDLSKEDRKQFGTLLFMDTVRGVHSTGVINVSNTRSPEYYKKALPAYDFLEMKGAAKIIEGFGVGLMGHNRHATIGAVNAENAHPFQHGNITGMHNGTLTRQSLLPDYKWFEVDSENIIYAIDKDGWEETIPKIEGAAALTWWNEDEKSLNIWRNDQRPLYYAYTEDRKTMYWASEAGFLRVVIGADRRKDAKKFPTIYSVKTDTHMKITYSMQKGVTVEETPIKGAPKPVVKHTGYLGNGSNYKYNYNQGKQQKKAKYPLYQTITLTGLGLKSDGKTTNAHLLFGHVKGDEKAIVKVAWVGTGFSLDEIDPKEEFLGSISHAINKGNGAYELIVVPASLKKEKAVH